MTLQILTNIVTPFTSGNSESRVYICVKYLSFNCFRWCNDITMIGILKSTFAYADHQWWINTSSARLYCLSKDNVLLKLNYSIARTNILTIYLDCRDQIETNTLQLWYCRTEFCQLSLIRDSRTYCGRMCPSCPHGNFHLEKLIKRIV